MTMTQWCAYDPNGLRVSVVYPYQGKFAVANRSYGGYPVLFSTKENAQADVELRNPCRVARWEAVEVAQ